MKTAVAHHWLVGMRGGEKALESILEMFPGADLFTLFYDGTRVSDLIRERKVTASFLNRLPGAARLYPNLIPLYPPAVRSLDLTGYDLVIMSDGSMIKGVKTSSRAVTVCYCHSPPRYLWDMADAYLANESFFKKAAARALTPYLREWDRARAQEVGHFVANSEFVKGRINSYYGRDAEVIHPPVEPFPEMPGAQKGEHYLLLGQLVPYKRPDLAVEAASRLGRKLVVAGEGPELGRLRAMAGPEVSFTGRLSDEEVRQELAACRALIFPGAEDFGIVPVEAQMAGRPVIAYGGGGALETVVEGETGLFFHDQTADALINKIEEFERKEGHFDAARIRRNAMRFEKSVFKKRFKEYVDSIMCPT